MPLLWRAPGRWDFSDFFLFGYGSFKKILLNLLHYCFCFILASRLVGVLVPWPRVELAPLALEGGVLTTGQWEKSWFSVLNPRKLKANLDQLVTVRARSQEPGKEEVQCSKLSLEYLYTPTSPKPFLLDPSLQISFQICSSWRISFLGYEICWNIPKITKLHLFLTWYSCTCPRNIFISVNENFGLRNSYYYLVSY